MDRYEIGCSVCGVIEYAASRAEAFRLAKLERRSHGQPDEAIQIYDRLAHHGRPQIWSADGEIISTRPGR